MKLSSAIPRHSGSFTNSEQKLLMENKNKIIAENIKRIEILKGWADQYSGVIRGNPREDLSRFGFQSKAMERKNLVESLSFILFVPDYLP